MDKDVVHFGMGFSTGVTTGVLLTIGTFGFVSYRAMKNVSNIVTAIGKHLPEPQPHLATVTPLNIEKEEQEGNYGTETTSTDSPPGAL